MSKPGQGQPDSRVIHGSAAPERNPDLGGCEVLCPGRDGYRIVIFKTDFYYRWCTGQDRGTTQELRLNLHRSRLLHGLFTVRSRLCLNLPCSQPPDLFAHHLAQ